MRYAFIEQFGNFIRSLKEHEPAQSICYRISHILEEVSCGENAELSNKITESLVDIAVLCDMLLITAAPP